MSDRFDDLKETINTNHVATIERLTTLETKLADLPERVRKLEAARNWLAGVIALLVTAITTWAGTKH